jgi:uncharacterized protein YdeI (YjbR/CyaY-like superfamily)
MARKGVESVLPENSYLAKSRKAWRAWLAKNHEDSTGVWLVTFKKTSGQPHLEYAATVEEALCFGWIDSIQRKVDEQRSMLYFAPRKAGSGWSALNKQRIEKLQEQGLLMPAGIAKIEAAKKDGSWGKLDDIEKLLIPEDLRLELVKYTNAMKCFDAFPKSVKRGILEWISNAKRPETRQRRVEETARLADLNERANQWKR